MSDSKLDDANDAMFDNQAEMDLTNYVDKLVKAEEDTPPLTSTVTQKEKSADSSLLDRVTSVQLSISKN